MRNNDARQSRPCGLKRRLLLARKEVELVWQGERFMNQALFDVFPERSLESIKFKRKQPAYREALKTLMDSIPERDNDDVPQSVPEPDSANFRQNIEEHLSAFPAPSSNAFMSARLAGICNSFTMKNQATIIKELYLRSVFPIKLRGARLITSLLTFLRDGTNVELSMHELRICSVKTGANVHACYWMT
ncbi:unnamed protein product [Lasius platythorax]|uniref:Uncharacterized protein n=1 Tax=Lasius platythorax TaxID=488582 RepID=A0AAV2MWD8_9HYME